MSQEDSKRNVFNETTKFLIPLILSAIAVIISIRSECHNFAQDKKYEKLAYLQDAATDRPLLTLIDPLDKLNWVFTIKKIDFVDNDSVLTIRFGVTVKGSLVFKNEGKSVAHLRAIAVADSFTASPILREAMLDEEERKTMLLRDISEKGFFYQRTIKESQVDSIDIERNIRYFSQDSMMVVHIILIYEDDMEALFDTYYWIRIHARKILVESKPLLIDGMPYAEFAFARSDLVAPIEDNTDYYLYRFNERNSIFSWWGKAGKELEKQKDNSINDP